MHPHPPLPRKQSSKCAQMLSDKSWHNSIHIENRFTQREDVYHEATSNHDKHLRTRGPGTICPSRSGQMGQWCLLNIFLKHTFTRETFYGFTEFKPCFSFCSVQYVLTLTCFKMFLILNSDRSHTKGAVRPLSVTYQHVSIYFWTTVFTLSSKWRAGWIWDHSKFNMSQKHNHPGNN